MAKYKTKFSGGPWDGLYFITDNIEDFGTTWSISEFKDPITNETIGRYYHWGTRSDPTLDSVWEPGKKRDWVMPDAEDS